jgi:hypothetical protein
MGENSPNLVTLRPIHLSQNLQTTFYSGKVAQQCGLLLCVTKCPKEEKQLSEKRKLVQSGHPDCGSSSVFSTSLSLFAYGQVSDHLGFF